MDVVLQPKCHTTPPLDLNSKITISVLKTSTTHSVYSHTELANFNQEFAFYFTDVTFGFQNTD